MNSDCEKVSGASQHLQVTQWMASIDGKGNHEALNRRMEEKQPSTTQTRAKNRFNSQQKESQCEKASRNSEQGQRRGTSHKVIHPGIQNTKDSAECHRKCVSDG
ncbi:hypothetical protein O181_001703 [Austropuccinia psidii MF-1]|uniref:Uncharacterized protein n=1 Tax=Austropuccinia psidii MF-1 TaxID=1389203 RepID=A0A9Q3BB13_9BASI|nr:hypothetical protein [Austropuccinia psidii MF-1]